MRSFLPNFLFLPLPPFINGLCYDERSSFYGDGEDIVAKMVFSGFDWGYYGLAPDVFMAKR